MLKTHNPISSYAGFIQTPKGANRQSVHLLTELNRDRLNVFKSFVFLSALFVAVAFPAFITVLALAS